MDGGREGDDTLSGGSGNDTLQGSEGTDRADYGGSPAAVKVNLGAGTLGLLVRSTCTRPAQGSSCVGGKKAPGVSPLG